MLPNPETFLLPQSYKKIPLFSTYYSQYKFSRNELSIEDMSENMVGFALLVPGLEYAAAGT